MITVGGRIARRESRLPAGPPPGMEDVLRAATDIPSGRYAPLARRVRRSLPAAPGLAARIELARLLALFHRATDEERITVLACLDDTVRDAAYPVMVSDDPRLLRIVDLVFDVRAALSALDTFTLQKEARP